MLLQGMSASRPQTPPAPTHCWEVPKQPWNRVHVDFAGPFMDSMFLVLVVDAFSKLEVAMMSSITCPRYSILGTMKTHLD